MKAAKDYNPLPARDIDGDESTELPPLHSAPKLLLALLVCTLAVNILLATQIIVQQQNKTDHIKSRYAGLQQNIPIPWLHEGPFASHNRSILDTAWATIDEDLGVIALSDDFVRKKGLPEAQRYPWDDSKGLYLLNAYHNLHCLNIIRKSLMEMHGKVPQTQHFRHVGHCLEAFRQDIICNADDTPRYTGISKIPAEGPASGLGQIKMCRDWKQLESWAREHSACYRSDSAGVDEHHVDWNHFKFCPDGSRPWEKQ